MSRKIFLPSRSNRGTDLRAVLLLSRHVERAESVPGWLLLLGYQRAGSMRCRDLLSHWLHHGAAVLKSGNILPRRVRLPQYVRWRVLLSQRNCPGAVSGGLVLPSGGHRPDPLRRRLLLPGRHSERAAFAVHDHLLLPAEQRGPDTVQGGLLLQQPPARRADALPRGQLLPGVDYEPLRLQRRQLLPQRHVGARPLPGRALLPRNEPGAHAVPGGLFLPGKLRGQVRVPGDELLPLRVLVQEPMPGGLLLQDLRHQGPVPARQLLPLGVADRRQVRPRLLLPDGRRERVPLPPRFVLPQVGTRPAGVLCGLLLPRVRHGRAPALHDWQLLPGGLLGAQSLPAWRLLPRHVVVFYTLPGGLLLPDPFEQARLPVGSVLRRRGDTGDPLRNRQLLSEELGER